MTDINIFSAEIAVLLDKQFDNPFQLALNNMIIGHRATILKQEYDKNGRYPLGSEDSVCLKLITVKAIECCCGDDLECTVRRTESRVPSPIRGNFKPDPFLFVGTANMSEAYTYAQPHSIDTILRYNKFTTLDTYYSFYNDYIYVFNSTSGRVGIRDVFSNPLELLSLKNCDGQNCLNNVYIEEDMKRVIKQMILEEFRVKITEDQEVRINEQ